MGAFVSNTGTWMEGVGVQWLMAEQTKSPMMMAVLAAAQFGPILALGMVGGVAADRINRKRLLVTTQLVMMGIAALLTAAAFAGVATPSTLIFLSLLQGITAAFNYAAWQVLTPRLVPRAELSRAIALNGVQFNLARVVGPALAGFIMAKMGAPSLFLINTISFVAVLSSMWGTPDAPVAGRAGERKGFVRAVVDDLREPMRFVFHTRGPLTVFMGMMLFSLLAGPVLRLLPLFVSESLGADERAFGLLMGVMGAGAVAGGLTLRLVPQWYPKHHLIPLSVLLGGVSILLFSASAGMIGASVSMFFIGVFWLWTFASSNAAMQLLVEDRMRGRVLSICNTAVFGALPIGAALASGAGRAADIIAGSGVNLGLEVRWGVGTLAAALIVSGLVMLVWRTPEVDGLAPGQPGYSRKPGLISGLTAHAHRPRITSQ